MTDQARLLKQLEEKDRELKRLREWQTLFMRATAHELRTPLTSVQGFAALLEPGLPIAQAESYLAIIRREAARLAAVVDDLSLRNDLENDRLQLATCPVAVEPILLELSRTLESFHRERQVRLSYATDLPHVAADPTCLQRILWTLLHNAARYSPTTYRILPVSVQVNQARRRLEFRVQDGAPRLPREHREDLFNPLPEMPKALARPRFGLGMGLYVARELARRMQGDLWLKVPAAPRGRKPAPRSRGNVFVLSLPFVEK